MIRLNIGCGPDVREGYVNIDKYHIQLNVIDYDVFNLPYSDNSVDEVMCLGVIEHFSFEDEERFFHEARRVLKPGGLFHFTVPDFESLVKQWLEAKDDFKGFYKAGAEEDWFGNGSRTIENRWGYLTASIFGNQNGGGQFHKNAYTVDKIKSIMKLFNYRYDIEFFNFKDTEIKMIRCKAWK
jgi:predicted SAM-dependent methyltransferase